MCFDFVIFLPNFSVQGEEVQSVRGCSGVFRGVLTVFWGCSWDVPGLFLVLQTPSKYLIESHCLSYIAQVGKHI